MAKNSKWHVRERAEEDTVVATSVVIADFLASPEVKRLSKSTRKEYAANLGAFSLWCDSHSVERGRAIVEADGTHPPLMLHEITNVVVSAFLEHIKATCRPAKAAHTTLSDHTLHQYVKDIKRLLNWCLDDEQYTEHIKPIVINRIQMPTIEQTVIDAFTDAQIDMLRRVCEQRHTRTYSEHLCLRDRLIVDLLLDTGIRVAELASLTIEHVHLERHDPYIRVYGKGRKWRDVGLGEETRRLVGRYLRTFREPTVEYQIHEQLNKLSPREQAAAKKDRIGKALLIVNRTGKPFTTSGIEQLVRKLGEYAGIDSTRCSPHTFRYTFAVRFMQANDNDIYRLSKLLGHTSVKVTENYLRSFKQSEARKGVRSPLDNLK